MACLYLQKPFALAGRYMRAVVGLGDVFVGEDWEASCPDSELIYAVGNLAIRREMKTGHVSAYSVIFLEDFVINNIWTTNRRLCLFYVGSIACPEAHAVFHEQSPLENMPLPKQT